MSNQTDLNIKESKNLIETYYEKYPKLKQFTEKQISFARNKGYVETILGRRRVLRDINSSNSIIKSAAERNAVNAPIQGSAADIIKMSMINIQKAFISKKISPFGLRFSDEKKSLVSKLNPIKWDENEISIGKEVTSSKESTIRH